MLQLLRKRGSLYMRAFTWQQTKLSTHKLNLVTLQLDIKLTINQKYEINWRFDPETERPSNTRRLKLHADIQIALSYDSHFN